jgi:hypothetical protein
VAKAEADAKAKKAAEEARANEIAEAEAKAQAAADAKAKAVTEPKAADQLAARQRGEQGEEPAPVIEVKPDRATIAREKPAPRPKPAAKPRPEAARAQPEEDSPLDGLDLRMIGMAAAGVLLVTILFVLWLRRRSLPNDADVTALAEEPGADAGEASAEDFSWGEDSSDAGQTLFDQPAPGPGAQEDLPAAAGTRSPDITAGPGSVDEHEKENEMDSETSGLPMDRTASEMPTSAGGSAVTGDVGRLVAELERRVAQMETRLDESVDARERLERQVAAQAEELRVQRAAIARTQRALRSLNRGEEEQATEPALREPSS